MNDSVGLQPRAEGGSNQGGNVRGKRGNHRGKNLGHTSESGGSRECRWLWRNEKGVLC